MDWENTGLLSGSGLSMSTSGQVSSKGLASKAGEQKDKLEDNNHYFLLLMKTIADLERKVVELEPPGNAKLKIK